jgi:hypothetical protein
MIPAEKQMELLSPSIWNEISNGFENQTNTKLTLTETILLKGKKNNKLTQRVLFYFICEGIRCGIGIELFNVTLNKIKKDKKEYDKAIIIATNVMIEEYKKYKEVSK